MTEHSQPLPYRFPFSLISTVLLTVAYTAHYLVVVDFNLLLWGLKILPLALFLPKLAQHHTRAHQWMGFLILFYVLDGVLIAAHPQAGIWQLSSGILITGLALTVYSSVIVHAYQKKKTLRRQTISQSVDKQ